MQHEVLKLVHLSLRRWLPVSRVWHFLGGSFFLFFSFLLIKKTNQPKKKYLLFFITGNFFFLWQKDKMVISSEIVLAPLAAHTLLSAWLMIMEGCSFMKKKVGEEDMTQCNTFWKMGTLYKQGWQNFALKMNLINKMKSTFSELRKNENFHLLYFTIYLKVFLQISLQN